MANILFYVPFNQRSRDNESLMIALHQLGHTVTCLNQLQGHDIHEILQKQGISTCSHVIPGRSNGWWYLLRHVFYFVRYCRRNHVNIVISHLEPANFVASVSQYLTRANTYLVRHHIDEAQLYNFDGNLFYLLTYRFARKVVVVSEKARRYVTEVEGLPSNKTIHINLGYDFNLYQLPTTTQTSEIRATYPAEVLLITVCRLTPYKRPQLAIELVGMLRENGVDAKLILLGQGEMHDRLIETINALELQEHVVMPGHINNVLHYLSASDFLVHPSMLDSSSVTVKEAGLVKLPVIVCEGVGDFDSYISNAETGFSVGSNSFVNDAYNVIVKYKDDKHKLEQIGVNLRGVILQKFGIDRTVKDWQELIKI